MASMTGVPFKKRESNSNNVACTKTIWNYDIRSLKLIERRSLTENKDIVETGLHSWNENIHKEHNLSIKWIKKKRTNK
jgi:hypothetical protein